MIRPLHPMDMPSYLAFAKRACRGEGVEGQDDSRVSRQFLDFLGRSLAFEAPKQTWVYTEGRSILGMIAVKTRPGAGAWEIDRFLGADCPDADVVLERLLEHLASIGGKEGIQKIFLRLPTSSPLVQVARRAGFFTYTSERAFRADGLALPAGLEPAPFHPRRPFHHQPLFDHYLRSAPVRTRQAEALTLQEWRWLDAWQPRRHWRFNLSRGRRDFVWEEGGRVIGWMRIEARDRLLRATLEPRQGRGDEAERTLAFAASQLTLVGGLFSLARDYQVLWESALLAHGFTLIEEYALMVKQLAVRVGDHCLIPVGV
ncbi:MAG: hypothetical protein ACYC3S_05935 [Chloroflexota bacterium]